MLTSLLMASIGLSNPEDLPAIIKPCTTESLNCPVVFSDSAESAYFELITGQRCESLIVEGHEVYINDIIPLINQKLINEENEILANWKPVWGKG